MVFKYFFKAWNNSLHNKSGDFRIPDSSNSAVLVVGGGGCSFVNFAVEIRTYFARKSLVFPTPPLQKNALRYQRILYIAENVHLMGYNSVADNTGLSSFV